MIYLTKHSVREPYANFSDFEINLVYVLEIYKVDPHFKENEIRHSRKSPVNNLWDLSYFGLLVEKEQNRVIFEKWQGSEKLKNEKSNCSIIAVSQEFCHFL